MGYHGALKIAADFTPTEPCAASLRKLLGTLPLVTQLEFIVVDCEEVARSKLQHVPPGVAVLSDDQALAVALYSYDLGPSSESDDGSDNFFVQLNEKLRLREGAVVRALRPYLYQLFCALDALPKHVSSADGIVYRGVPAAALAVVQQKYADGTEVFWSAFTSTSTDVGTAKSFAEGAGGIIFRCKVLQGCIIRAYSAIDMEKEVLLRPNTKFFVDAPCRLETAGKLAGFYVVKLKEIAGKFVF